MKRSRDLRTTLAAAVIAALIGPGAAAAWAATSSSVDTTDVVVPRLPGREADSALGLEALLPAGVADTSVGGQATATALGVPDVLTVGEAHTAQERSHVTTIGVAGVELLGHEGEQYPVTPWPAEPSGSPTGVLAPVGTALAQVNDELCPDGRGGGGPCIAVLDARTVDSFWSRLDLHSAQFSALTVEVAGQSVSLLNTNADTISLHDAAAGTRCENEASAFLVTGSGLGATLLGTVGTVAQEGFTPCATP